MKTLDKNDHNSAVAELFANISPEIAESFNDEQLEVINKAFSSRRWNRHPIDLRVSVPIAGLQFYLVFVAGRERRSKQRLHSQKGLYPFLTPGNIVFITGFLTILSISSFTVFPFLFSSLTSVFRSSPYPTAIPWLENKVDCQHTGRSWKNNECLDYEHNPMF
ncbi:MAG: hypothetical protein DSM106950_32655 [Stigonema ocellatum SAG 48.90 = DSM 106950]|nr:hypothetical protein [Stigonema ocellatum SAG 48.90 = DSM 106950]